MVIKGKTYLTSINWWELDKSGQIKNGGDANKLLTRDAYRPGFEYSADKI
mgnify:CR=1 FL=1